MNSARRVAKQFQILRNVEANARIAIPCAQEPKCVATLINEPEFSLAHEIEHNKSVFLEDRNHDWSWTEGELRYYSRVAQVADVLLVFEFA